MINKKLLVLFDECLEGLCDNNYTEEKKADILFAIKLLCIEYKIEKPEWWNRVRNKIQWINKDGSFIYEGIDLGGF